MKKKLKKMKNPFCVFYSLFQQKKPEKTYKATQSKEEERRRTRQRKIWAK